MSMLLRALGVVLAIVFTTAGAHQGQQRLAEPAFLNLAAGTPQFSSPEMGVSIDLGDGAKRMTSWPVDPEHVGSLCLDENRNGVVDLPNEWVGGTTGPPNGLEALDAYDGYATMEDLKGDRNRHPDGKLDAADAIFAKLIVWRDINRNGVPEEDELESVQHAGIVSISTGYERVFTYDSVGNEHRYRALALMRSKAGVPVAREVWTLRLAQR